MPVTKEVMEVEDDGPIVVQAATKSARVKGTWQFYYGQYLFDFEDGNYYDLPLDVFEYLKASGNIYDTMS